MTEINIVERLKVYQEQVEYWLREVKGTRFNKEENTTVKFVVPLLEMLKWDPLKDIEFEYYIRSKDKKGGRFVDAILYVDNKPTFLVEVKPIQDELFSASRQIFNYLINSGIFYGIVTNGRELVVFSRKYCRKGYKRGRELFRFRLEVDKEEKKNDFIDYYDVLLIISKDYVEKGIFDALVKAYQTKEYWDWRKRRKDKYSENELSLEFARDFLRNSRYACSIQPK